METFSSNHRQSNSVILPSDANIRSTKWHFLNYSCHQDQSDICNRVHVLYLRKNTFFTNQVVSVGVSTWRRWYGWLDGWMAWRRQLCGCENAGGIQSCFQMTKRRLIWHFLHFYYIPFRFFGERMEKYVIFLCLYIILWTYIQSFVSCEMMHFVILMLDWNNYPIWIWTFPILLYSFSVERFSFAIQLSPRTLSSPFPAAFTVKTSSSSSPSSSLKQFTQFQPSPNPYPVTVHPEMIKMWGFSG